MLLYSPAERFEVSSHHDPLAVGEHVVNWEAQIDNKFDYGDQNVTMVV
jgi:hypothetical protein